MSIYRGGGIEGNSTNQIMGAFRSLSDDWVRLDSRTVAISEASRRNGFKI